MIRVDTDYAVFADTGCYSAAKRYVPTTGMNAGKEQWQQFAHYSTLHGTVSAIVRRMQREAVEALNAVEMRVHEWVREEVRA